MTPDQLFGLLTEANIVSFFFKAFAIFFCSFYLIYGLIITKEVNILNNTLIMKNNRLILYITGIQILIGLALVFLAIFYK